MKTLLFLRHGKSDWSADYDSDVDRPLAKRGKKAAKRIGAFLCESDFMPDLVVTSTAVRAVGTLDIVRGVSGWEGPVHATDRLYGATADDVVQLIREVPDDVNVLMLVGHEPTTSETLSVLIGGGDIRVPTGAVACVDLDIEHWADATAGMGLLQWLVTPKLLGGK